MDNFTIKRITSSDDNTLRFLQKSFPGVAWDHSHLRIFLNSPSNILLVAKSLDKGLGLLRAHVLPRYDAKTEEILLHEIDVLPEHQKRGIATALVKN